MLLKEISYYRTGGTCDRLTSPGSVEELADVLSEVHRDGTPCFLLGAGSNSLIMDTHWPGAVILFNNLQEMQIRNNTVIVQAGVDNTVLTRRCHDAGLSGAEWMHFLPGQLGATVRMNARCYGGEISRIVRSVTAVTLEGNIRRYETDAVFRGYKETLFMNRPEAVVEVEIELSPGVPDRIGKRMEFCRKDREAKHQFDYPTCGCVFKNDYDAGVPSGLLLDRAGVRDLGSELLEISPWHANFVFNKGASARQILELTLQMREAVYDRFGVWLAYELEVLGGLPEDLRQRFQEVRPPAFREKELAPLRSRFADSQVSPSDPDG